LQKAEDIRRPLEDNIDRMIEACDIDGLLKAPDSPTHEAFKVWLWSVAARNAGKIEALKFEVKE